MNKMSETMTDVELFQEVFNRVQAHHHRISMKGTLVYYDNEIEFNTQDFSLAYNCYQLGKMMNKHGEFE